MKILFLTNIPSPYRVDFFNELGKLCDLTVLFEKQIAQDREIQWFEEKATSYRAVFLHGIPVGSDSSLCFPVLKYLREEWDIIIVGGYSTPTGLLAVQYLNTKKIPFILNCDGGTTKQESKLQYKIKKHFISSAVGWLSPGETTDTYLLHYGADSRYIFRYHFTSVRQDKILDKPLSVEEKSLWKKQLSITENRAIISVGRFIESKGFDILLDACRKFDREIGIYIIGGKATPEYKQYVDQHHLTHVHFIEFKTKSELAPYYIAADLFVLPTRKDVWGLVINEAMSFGVPVITTDQCVAGLELIKNGQNGYIVPSNDPMALSEKIIEVLNDYALTRKMMYNNLYKISEYTIEKMAQQHMEIFKQIVGGER